MAAKHERGDACHGGTEQRGKNEGKRREGDRRVVCMAAPPHSAAPLFLLLRFLYLCAAVRISVADERTTHVVLVDPLSKPYPLPSHGGWYSSLLSSTASSSSSSFSLQLIHVYGTLLHGFSARLTPGESRRLRASDGVLTVCADAVLLPHTTRSSSFLGLDLPGSLLSRVSDLGSDIVIGVVDTGIWPESPSFADPGELGPVPARWKGECEEGNGFNSSSCRGKLIGARSFYEGYLASSPLLPLSASAESLSARDMDGHGTHVASIAAGVPVGGAGFGGFAAGFARGMAPKARVAAYKVCWSGRCLVSDIVAALDRAVEDGVDVISLSLGSASPVSSYQLDPLAIASFRATMAGVLVVSSAGNGGPVPGSVWNAPPWVLTVAAGTMDRSFPATIILGNGKRLRGTSITLPYPPNNRKDQLPRRLYSAGLITSPHPVNFTPLEGGVVFCNTDRHTPRMELGSALQDAGAAVMVITHGDLDPDGALAEPHVIPTVAVGAAEAAAIGSYISRAKNPTAVVTSEGTVLGGPAPAVASFSAPGPDPAAQRVLKPDLLAPGVDVLGAWTGAAGPSGLRSDTRRARFNVMSGTSMACPHASGVAALLRSAHRGWNPGEIKSALMTTASAVQGIRDESTGLPAGPFAIGAGHVRPERAVAPGLVYPVDPGDYVDFFVCGLNYTEKDVRLMTGRRRSVNGSRGRCSKRKSSWDLNYPGFAVEEEEAVSKGEVAFYRKVKRVDVGIAVYSAEVVAPEGYEASVTPSRLRFGGREGETVGFKVVVRWVGQRKGRKERNGGGWWGGGHLAWRDDVGNHTVRSPVVFFSSRRLKARWAAGLG